jgi:molybdopterin molybdotransferase
LEFFNLSRPVEALDKYLAQWAPVRRPEEALDIFTAVGRVLARDIDVDTDVPAFDRSTVDGFAVRAKDTFGATETTPALFTIAGEVLMGQAAEGRVSAGRAFRIPTGGMLPEGADAVVMVEYTEALEDTTIAIVKDVAPGENVIHTGEDLSKGEVLLGQGRRLTAHDIGALSAVSVASVPVFMPPTVSVVSTGNEIVPAGVEPGPGQVRDINGPALVAAVSTTGCRGRFAGVFTDDCETLLRVCRDEIDAGADALIMSGGSSVGPMDLTPRVLNALGRPGVLVHGLALRPGKPTILSLAGSVPVFGLPGHPASALVVFDIIVKPLLRVLSGEPAATVLASEGARPSVKAVLERNLSSGPGREEHVRVRLVNKAGKLYARPVFGKSGLISTLVRADGTVRIPEESGGFEAGQVVDVYPWGV